MSLKVLHGAPEKTGERNHPLSSRQVRPPSSPATRKAKSVVADGALVSDSYPEENWGARLYRMLFEAPVLDFERMRAWLTTLQDRRFYSSPRGLNFDIVDEYFRLHGFELSAGMTLKPARRILSRFREVSGLLHPREQVHAVSPGDPIFQSRDSSFSRTGRVKTDPGRPKTDPGRSTNGSRSHGNTGQSRYFELPAPSLIVTSQRIICRSRDNGEGTWVSHFYCDIFDESPSILSWIADAGWHRALDNDDDRYYASVRYYDVYGQRQTIDAFDRNGARLVSWIISKVGERKLRRRHRSIRHLPKARSYTERKVQERHLFVPTLLRAAGYLTQVAKEYHPPVEQEEETGRV